MVSRDHLDARTPMFGLAELEPKLQPFYLRRVSRAKLDAYPLLRQG